MNLDKDHLAEPWNAGSFRICPMMAQTPQPLPLPLAPNLITPPAPPPTEHANGR